MDRIQLAAGTLIVVLAGVAMGCQPVEDVPVGGSPTPAPPPTDPPGRPVETMPSGVHELLDELDSTAAQWQAGATPVEIVAQLDGDALTSVRVTYLAPDADRFLLVRVTPEGMTQERPTLAGLELEPVPEPHLEAVPPVPERLVDPLPLVEAAGPALERCGVDEVHTVLYDTGAPAAWDGERWTEPPTWTATLTGSGGAVVVDPIAGDGTGAGCLVD